MIDRIIGTGLFAGFDLTKYRHLQNLANALEYWLAGGRDDRSKEMKKLTQLQQSAIGNIAYRMDNSPLLKEIISPILHVPRDGGRTAPPELLAAGKDLIDYAITSAWHPRAHAYQDALSAWQNRWPLQLTGNIHPRHEEMHEAAQRHYKLEQAQKKKKKPVPGGIESDYTDTDDEQQPKNKKRKKKSATKRAPSSATFSRAFSTSLRLSQPSHISGEERPNKKRKTISLPEATARGSTTSSLSATASRQPSPPTHIADEGRSNKKRKTNPLTEATARASTNSLPPLILDLQSSPTHGSSDTGERSFTGLPPLISNRPAPLLSQNSTTTEECSANSGPKSSTKPITQPRRFSAKPSTASLPANSFYQPPRPPSRRSSRLSQVVNYRELSPDLEVLEEPASMATVSEEDEKRFRQEQRLALIMSYDLPRNGLPDGANPGNITPPQATMNKEEEVSSTEGPQFIFEDPSKFAPRKTRGDKALDDGTIDFSSAQVGTRDDSKLSLDFNTTRSNPEKPDTMIPGERVTNRYLLPVDFNDRNSVRKLNMWRKQIIGRNFPEKKSKTIHAWLLSEKMLVLELVREQMADFGYIKWNRLANTYNKRMAGVLQQAGGDLVAQGNRKACLLKEDRIAPWRTKSALMGLRERWPEIKDMIEAALPEVDDDEDGEGEEGEVVDSGDDDEEILEIGSSPSA